MAQLVHDIEALRSLHGVLERAQWDLNACRTSAVSLDASQLPCPGLGRALVDFIAAGREGHERVVRCLSSIANLARAAVDCYAEVENTLVQTMEAEG